MTETGVAAATAANQTFLDTCEAVTGYHLTTDSRNREVFIFEYDDMAELPEVPASIGARVAWTVADWGYSIPSLDDETR